MYWSVPAEGLKNGGGGWGRDNQIEGESQNLRLGYIIIINAFSIFNFLTKIDYKHNNYRNSSNKTVSIRTDF